MSNSTFTVAQGIHGKGLMAARRLEKDEVLAKIEGEIVQDENYESNTCMDLGEDLSLEPAEPFCYLNHSCDPNCELFSWEPDPGEEDDNSLHLAVIRDVEAGEELTIDYGWPAHFAHPCECGSSNCRGWIVDEEDLPELMERLKAESEAEGDVALT